MRLWLFIALVFAVSACRTGIDLQIEIPQTKPNALQYGYGPGRTNAAESETGYPIALSWNESLSSGTGSSSPLIASGIAFIPTLLNGVDVFDITLGKEIGWITVPGSVIGTPAIRDSIIYIPLSGGKSSMAAVHLSRETVLWLQNGESVEAPVLLLGDYVVTAGVYGTVACVRHGDSAVVWTRKLPKPVIAAPAGADTTVLVACTNGDLYALSLHDGRERWRVPTGSAFHAAPVSDGSAVYAINRDGNLIACEIATGIVRWKSDAGVPVYSSPALYDKLLIVPGTDGILRTYNIDNGECIRTHDIGSVPGGCPVVSGSLLIVATMNGRLEILDVSTSKLLWSAQFDVRFRTSPIVTPGSVCLINDEGEIIGFRSDK